MHWIRWQKNHKRKKNSSPNSVMKQSPINHNRIRWWNSHWKICFNWHLICGHWIRWTNQCWICHRIRCITKFFTEFGAVKHTFSFTGGYRAHTSPPPMNKVRGASNPFFPNYVTDLLKKMGFPFTLVSKRTQRIEVNASTTKRDMNDLILNNKQFVAKL